MKDRSETDRILMNLRAALDWDCRFPNNVFRGTWGSYLFFDSDWMFCAEFVPWVKSLLRAEGGTCACIYDIDAMQANDSLLPTSFAINSATSGAEYQSFLKGSRTETSWTSFVDRYACTSDRAIWCLYCERNNEIAVIALKSDALRGLLSEVHAMPIADAIALPLSYGFSDRNLSVLWRTELLGAYGHG